MWPFDRSAAVADRIEPRIVNASPENPSTSLANPDDWLLDWASGGASYAGPHVSEQTAMRSTTVFRCVSLVSGLIASLPLSVYEKQEDGRRQATDHRCYSLLHDEPNDLMGSFTWRELIGVDLLLGGNSYSFIERDNANRIVGFLYLLRSQVRPYRYKGTTRYEITTSDGKIDVGQSEVLHIPGIGFDGLKGISPIGWAGKQPIGLDLAMSEYIARMHANGVRPSGFVEVPAGISPDGLKRLKAQFETDHAGVRNAGRTIYGDVGSKWTPISLTPEDAETLESRRYGVGDICRLFGVPPHMAGETDKTTSWGTGIEQQSLGFLRFTMEPWLKRIEDEFKRKLFSNSRFYAEFDRDALLAMDSAASAAFFQSGVQNGWMKPSEIRHKRNLPPAEGADQLFISANLKPIDQAGSAPAGV